MKRFIVSILICLCILAQAAFALSNIKWLYPKNIKTYIPQNDTNSIMMRHAFEEWTRVTNNKIIFVFVKSPEISQIDVQFVPQIEYSNDKAIGLTKTRSTTNKMLHATVYIAKKTQQGKTLNRDEIYTTMLHEVGHAIGLNHTSNKKSVMFPGVNVIQEIQKSDISTLAELYNW